MDGDRDGESAQYNESPGPESVADTWRVARSPVRAGFSQRANAAGEDGLGPAARDDVEGALLPR